MCQQVSEMPWTRHFYSSCNKKCKMQVSWLDIETQKMVKLCFDMNNFRTLTCQYHNV